MNNIGWITIAKAESVSELENVTPSISELKPGTRGRVIVEGMPWLSARIFDLAWAEQAFGSRLVPEGAKVIDCHEENGIGYVEFEVTGTPVHIIILAVVAALVALGITIATISIAIQTPKDIKWIMTIIAVIIAIIIIGIIIVKPKFAVGTS